LVGDRLAAFMVRAAVSGAIDYATADPYNKAWQIKHSLILKEIARKEDEKLIVAVQQHWLAYVSHSSLEADSWTKIKNQAAETLKKLQNTVLPWLEGAEPTEEKDTIEGKYGNLIKQYREMVSRQQAETGDASAES
jgi:hypothetical protein